MNNLTTEQQNINKNCNEAIDRLRKKQVEILLNANNMFFEIEKQIKELQNLKDVSKE